MSPEQSSKIMWGLNEMAKIVEANAVEKGFRQPGLQCDREAVAVFISNLHGETSELWEAFRNGKLSQPCDKADKMVDAGLPMLTSAAEELADILIRTLDTARAFGVDIGQAVIAKHRYNATRPHLHGGKKA